MDCFMYEAFYRLAAKPFSILPDPDIIYWGRNHRLAFAMLEYGIMNSAGFTVITGEIGCGKTTLLRYLLRNLDNQMTVGLITSTPRGKAELLQWVMISLNQPFEDSYPALYKRFQQFLREQYSSGRRTVVIIDEAQNLEWETLEELRMLSNINVDKDLYLQLILIGQPQLKDLLRSPQLLQFAQRVSSDFHLRPLSANEVAEYIHCRLEAVGGKVRLFSEEACQIIAQASQGIPRTINVLCDTALVYGFAQSAELITAELVKMVIENKRQFGVLPLPL
jgi:general secretion pathway protein A